MIIALAAYLIAAAAFAFWAGRRIARALGV